MAARSSRLLFYARAVIAALLAIAAFGVADRIVGDRVANALTFILMIGPALLLAIAVEVLMSDYARTAYSWRAALSDAGVAAFAAFIILVGATRLREPIFDHPAPWVFMAVLIVPLSVSIGYLRSLRAPAVSSQSEDR